MIHARLYLWLGVSSPLPGQQLCQTSGLCCFCCTCPMPGSGTRRVEQKLWGGTATICSVCSLVCLLALPAPVLSSGGRREELSPDLAHLSTVRACLGKDLVSVQQSIIWFAACFWRGMQFLSKHRLLSGCFVLSTQGVTRPLHEARPGNAASVRGQPALPSSPHPSPRESSQTLWSPLVSANNLKEKSKAFSVQMLELCCPPLG